MAAPSLPHQLLEQLQQPRVLAGIFLVLLAIVVQRLFSRKRLEFPGPPKSHWLTGNLYDLINNEAMTTQIEWVRKYGLYVHYSLVAFSDRLLIADVKALQHILSTNSANYAKPHRELTLLRNLVGEGLLTADTAPHQRQRKILNPIFHYSNLKTLLPVFANSAMELRAKWLEEFKKVSTSENPKLDIDVQKEVTNVAVDVIGRAGFDHDFKAVELGADKNVVFQCISTVLGPANAGILLTIPGFTLLPIEYNRQFKKAVKTLHATIDNIVAEKKERMAKEGAAAARPSLFDLILKASEEPGADVFDSKELADQIMTFLAAGNETSATGMTWVLYFLSIHQDVQDKLRAEVSDMLSSDMELQADSWEAADRLPYLNNVVRETLRLRPPIPTFLRTPINDDVVNGHFIPAGTRIVINTAVVHRLPELWGEDADEFRPNRWEKNEPVSVYAFLPFAMGPRNCIGNRFALLEMKVVIAILVRTFKFEPVEGFEVKAKHSISLRPDPSLMLKVSLAN